jgi:hypothetical protein
VADNSASGGGGIYNDSVLSDTTVVKIYSSTVSSNTALSGSGGGLLNTGRYASGLGGQIDIENSTFSGNSTPFSGGGIFNDGEQGNAYLKIENSTFSGNSAVYYGGAIFNDALYGGRASLVIGNTILTAGVSDGTIVNLSDLSYTNARVTSLGYNLSTDGSEGLLTGPGDLLYTDPLLGPLANNGGPTRTHARSPYSPAIDAGNPAFTPPPDFDQRGSGFPRIADGRIDIGAFEYGSMPPVLRPLNLVIIGSGAVAPFTNGQLLEVGSQYTLKATPARGNVFGNWTGDIVSADPSLAFTMSWNSSFVATFTPSPFPALKGSYSGLFYDTNGPAHQNAGGFTLQLTPKGTFSAKIQQGAARYSFSGQVDGTLAAQKSIKRPASDDLLINLQFAVGSPPFRVSGLVSNSTWTAQLLGYRAVFTAPGPPATNFQGKYTFLLPGSPDPAVSPPLSGAGTLTVNRSGNVAVRATLGDGKAVAQTAAMASNGQWPFYASMYSGKGSVFGWLTLLAADTNDVSGSLLWTRPADPHVLLYPTGFTNETECFGSRYIIPPLNTPVLAISSGLVLLDGGNLAPPITNSITLDSRNKFDIPPSAASLNLNLSPSAGTFRGSFLHPQTGKRVQVQGVVLEKQDLGAGFFLGPTQSGKVYLSP